jgi:hypothetical protein
MKKTTLVLVMSLLCASTALAIDSGNNSVYIDQTNADQSVTAITQSGSGNNVGDRTNLVTPSFVIDGNNMNLTIEQDGMNNSIIGTFIGGDSTATISQIGSGNSLILNQGNFGTNGGIMTISNSGDNNSIILNMAISANTSNYNYSASVIGNTNSIVSNMNSKYIENTITVTGSNNNFTTTQIGANGTPLIVGHKIQSSIIGDTNTVVITQNGTTTPNIVTLNVTGNNTSTTIIQH